MTATRDDFAHSRLNNHRRDGGRFAAAANAAAAVNTAASGLLVCVLRLCAGLRKSPPTVHLAFTQLARAHAPFDVVARGERRAASGASGASGASVLATAAAFYFSSSCALD